MSDVDADWADGCGVTQADADVVRIERSEIVKADAWKYIPTVVKRNDAEAFLQGERYARFGIDDEQFVSSAGHVDLGAIWNGLAGTAHKDIALRPGTIERVAAQRIGAAGKECLAQGNEAIGKRLRKTDANAIGPNDVVKLLFVECSLRGQFRKVDVGSKLGRIDV